MIDNLQWTAHFVFVEYNVEIEKIRMSESCLLQTIELNCLISDLVSSFIQNTNKEFWKVGQYTMIRLIKHETLFHS